ncbi:hypothetical protein [Bacteroides acidifaciens]|nr:hypothetical protein [Bacteroides acidifaciens]
MLLSKKSPQIIIEDNIASVTTYILAMNIVVALCLKKLDKRLL